MRAIFKKMTNPQIGAWFEGKIMEALKDIKKESKHHLVLHRFYDSKSAGSLIPPQPADFLVATVTNVWLVEAKASFNNKSLTSCLANAVSGHQASAQILWDRVNKPSLYLFFCAQTERVEMWNGLPVSRIKILRGARLSKAVQVDGVEYQALLKKFDLKDLKQELFQTFIEGR